MGRYVGWGCILNCFMLSSLPCFYAFHWSAIPTSCYIFNVFILVHVTVFSSRCMLELQFAIYHRTATPSSRASYAVFTEESQASFKHSSHTNSISNSAILHNNYISLLSDLCTCVHVKKNGVVKEAIVLQWAVWIASCDFKPGKKRWAGALLSEKCCCFVQKPLWKSHANLN